MGVGRSSFYDWEKRQERGPDPQRAELIDWVKDTCHCVVEIAKRDPNIKEFQVLPRRWVVGRTFGWLSQYRRLSRDYKVLTETSEAMISAAMVHLMVRRLVRQAQTSGPYWVFQTRS